MVTGFFGRQADPLTICRCCNDLTMATASASSSWSSSSTTSTSSSKPTRGTSENDNYTQGQMNGLRLVNAVNLESQDMYRDLFARVISLQLDADWDDGELWIPWCYINYKLVKKYSFFKKLKKKSTKSLWINEKCIPSFHEMDLSFFAYLTENHPKIPERVGEASIALREMRNAFAHVGREKVVRSDDELRIEFERLVDNVVTPMFEDFPDLIPRWEKRLRKLRDGKMDGAIREAEEVTPIVEPPRFRRFHLYDSIAEELEDPYEHVSLSAPVPADEKDVVFSGNPLPSPIPLQAFKLEPIFQDVPTSASGESVSWLTSKRFCVGYGFVAAEINGTILLWGGRQCQPDNTKPFLPHRIVYFLQVKPINWRHVVAKGQPPPGTAFAAYSVLKDKVYLMGGYRPGGEITNETVTLDSSGEFVRLLPSGDVPSPRAGHGAWTHLGRVYFFAGLGPMVDSYGGRFSEDVRTVWMEAHSNPGNFYNNQLFEFDPASGRYSLVLTSGTAPYPQTFFAVAKLRENAYIHGGRRFHVLNMNTSSWSELKSGMTRDLIHHTLVPVSTSQLLLIGGSRGSTISNEIHVYDIEKTAWRQDHGIRRFRVDVEGLLLHRVVVVTKKGNAKRVLCIGGFTDAAKKNHLDHMLLLQLF